MTHASYRMITETNLPDNETHYNRKSYKWDRKDFIIYVYHPKNSPAINFPNFTIKKQLSFETRNPQSWFSLIQSKLPEIKKIMFDNLPFAFSTCLKKILVTDRLYFECFAYKKRDCEKYGVECKYFNKKCDDRFNEREFVLNFHLLKSDTEKGIDEWLDLFKYNHITFSDLKYIENFRNQVFFV